MKRIARVALVGVLLICGVVRIGWCKENAEQYKKDLQHVQGLLEAANRYDKGFLFAEQAYAYALEHLGPKDPATLNSMNNLAKLYRSQGWDSKADLLYKNKKVLAKKQTDTLIKLNGRQHANITQMPAAKNTRIFQPSKKKLRQAHAETLTSINNLAFFYQDQGRYSEAEPLLKKSLQIREKMLGREHPDTLTSIQSLALLYQDQGRYTRANA
jgi:tetratricopeptide (TPR) repeat protein